MGTLRNKWSIGQLTPFQALGPLGQMQTKAWLLF